MMLRRRKGAPLRIRGRKCAEASHPLDGGRRILACLYRYGTGSFAAAVFEEPSTDANCASSAQHSTEPAVDEKPEGDPPFAEAVSARSFEALCTGLEALVQDLSFQSNGVMPEHDPTSLLQARLMDAMRAEAVAVCVGTLLHRASQGTSDEPSAMKRQGLETGTRPGPRDCASSTAVEAR
ncbi:MAG: hypothetical protein AAF526_01235 [Pseudomonadota bacterium]